MSTAFRCWVLFIPRRQEACFGRGQGILALFVRNVDANLTRRLALRRRDRRDNPRLVQFINKLFRLHVYPQPPTLNRPLSTLNSASTQHSVLPTAAGAAAAKASAAT